MSQMKPLLITCPECGQEYSFPVWTNIDTELNPEMKEKVRDLSTFGFVCPNCGMNIMVHYNFLYYQKEDEIKIFCAITDKYYEQLLKMLSDEDPSMHLDDNGSIKKIYEKYGKDIFSTDNTRIVRNYNEFQEKLNLLDNKLDDRIIEFLKAMFLYRYYEDLPESTKNVEFYYVPSEDDNITFDVYSNGKKTASLALEREIYDWLFPIYQEYLKKVDADSYEINPVWALKTQFLINEILEGDSTDK